MSVALLSFLDGLAQLTAKYGPFLTLLLSILAQKYLSQCPGAEITVSSTDSDGIRQVDIQQNDNLIGTSDSDVFGHATKNHLVDHPAVAVILVLVIGQLPEIKNISSTTLSDIYNGSIAKWQMANVGYQKNGDITIVSRPTDSAIQGIFDRFVLGGPETVPGPASLMTDNSDTLAQRITQGSGRIGYIPLFYVNRYNLQPVTIDNLGPSIDLVKNGSYKLWNIEHLYTRGQATGLAKSFLDYISTFEGRSIAEQNGYVSAKDIPNLLAGHE